MISSLNQVVKGHLCMSCGACFNSCEKVIDQEGLKLPQFSQEITSDQELFQLCPGKGYNIDALAGQGPKYCLELGRYEKLYAAKSTSELILRKASSGGVMTAIADFLLEQNLVDGVIVTKIVCEDGTVSAEPFIARCLEDLLQAQGSKYMPVSNLNFIKTLEGSKERYAMIGTPCHIAGVRLLQQRHPIWRERIPYTIGNFCGGFRDFREFKSICHNLNIDIRQVADLSYRGDGQPGYMTITLKNGNRVRLNYPAYAKMTGYPVIRRCRLCIDATAELADFSCGDAWLPRFRECNDVRSVIIARSEKAKFIVDEMTEKKLLDCQNITQDEVILSQKTNLNSKKRRQFARRKVFSRLWQKLPDFPVGYDQQHCSSRLELKVLISHGFFYYLQRLGCYSLFAKLTKRNKTKVEFLYADEQRKRQ